MLMLKMLLIFTAIFPLFAFAKDIQTLELPSGEEMDMRIFPAQGDSLILGFACDFGEGKNQEYTAQSLADDGIEVWMPDFLSSYMFTKTKSDLDKIPHKDLMKVLQLALETGKKVYLLSSGMESKLPLNTLADAEHNKMALDNFAGVLLLFPRLYDKTPEPGVEPTYVASVGQTTKPIMIIEGGNTPNKWGLAHLKSKLETSGSEVVTKVIPDIRGYFFSRKDPNREEDVVTSQLSGVIKTGLFFIDKEADK